LKPYQNKEKEPFATKAEKVPVHACVGLVWGHLLRGTSRAIYTPQTVGSYNSH